jgi:hypothetical protein
MKKFTPYGNATILQGKENEKHLLLEQCAIVGGMFGTVYIDKKYVYGYNGYDCYQFPLKQFTKALRLLVNEQPKYIRVYDNGGETFDRYTVVFTGNYLKTGSDGVRRFQYVGMSENPYHPQGFCQHGESEWQPIDRPTYSHLGKKITFDKLPQDCQKAVLDDYASIWGF